ncbi:VOC family protein [Streptomyces sp. NPDC001251]
MSDIDAAEQQVPALGATALDPDDRGGERGFRVCADPAGRPFRPFRPFRPLLPFLLCRA